MPPGRRVETGYVFSSVRVECTRAAAGFTWLILISFRDYILLCSF